MASENGEWLRIAISEAKVKSEEWCLTKCDMVSKRAVMFETVNGGRTLRKPFRSCSIHQRWITQLNLFAGQLYLDSFKEYTDLCEFLGLAWEAAEEGEVVGADGFVQPAAGIRGFIHSPVEFLKVLMTKIRRNCEGIEKTHLGKILHGSLLEEADFDE